MPGPACSSVLLRVCHDTVFVLGTVNLRSLERLKKRYGLAEPRNEPGNVVSLFSYAGTATSASRAAPLVAVTGCDLHLPRQRKHIREQPGGQQRCRIDLARLRMRFRFLQNGREIVQCADERGHRGLIHRDLHSTLLTQLPPDGFFTRILDHHHDVRWVGFGLIADKYACELALRMQVALFVQRPHLSRVLGGEQLRRKAAECVADVVHIPLQHLERGVVAGRIGDLRQIDDDWSAGIDQDIELGEVAVDETDAQHAHHLAHQGVVILTCSLG